MKALKDAGLTEGEVLKRATLDHIKGELQRQYFSQGRYDATIDVNHDC
jgi:outer membrane protein insertion porin family